MKRENVWIRVAGNAEMIRGGQPFHWRCFVDKQQPEIPLSGWHIEGHSTQRNMIPGTKPGGDELGLVAWIDFFGHIEIDHDSVARITLCEVS